MVDFGQATSLHSRIRSDVERRILSGEWKPGDRIPFEHELMVEYSCSRMTVSKALSSLAGAGLIQRRRRAGSFVAPQHVDMAALAIPDIRAEIQKNGAIYTLELIERHVHELTSSAEPPFELGTRLLRLSCRHLADNRPFATERRSINLSEVPAAEDVDFGIVPPGSWLLSNVPWTEAENRIGARLAEADGDLLNIGVDSACLMLERHTWRAGVPITSVRQVFPASGFSLVARFAGMNPDG
ncbi:UTRA domain-containing protein [Sphingomonas sp. CFBP 13720]|uniref:UTRA domain-containing protein n=1 Tax=Sphingomonas sp. CFBP 13720 TaxID=2775302 RepID=UPI001787064A|nr:UTRA domain-containing protein [Sphingomonas sp. CFBP 13720]MBD8679868.1 UTRA domain-containing protein [Sphingomonas sp. CFBP 13720]